MKEIYLKDIFGENITVQYDENAPCKICGLPVVHASMGGTDVCPWCDCGVYRDGTKMTYRELTINDKLRKKAEEIYEQKYNQRENRGILTKA